MNSEFYPGWLTHWSEKFAQTDTENIVTTLRKMLDQKINVNFYVFFGGTNFEYTSGKVSRIQRFTFHIRSKKTMYTNKIIRCCLRV